MPVTDFALHLSKLMRFGWFGWFGHVLIPTAMPLSPFCPPPIWWAEPIVLENSLVVEWHMQDSAAKRNFLFNIRSDVILWIHQWKKIGLHFLLTSWIPFCGHPGRHLGDNPKNEQTRYDVGLFTSHYQSHFGVWMILIHTNQHHPKNSPPQVCDQHQPDRFAPVQFQCAVQREILKSPWVG